MVPLADCPRVAVGAKKTAACPHCLARGRVEAIRTRGPRHGAAPVLAAYRCLGGCLPAEDQRRHDDADAKKRDYFARFDLGKIEEIARSEIPHWRPTAAFPHVVRPLANRPSPGGHPQRRGPVHEAESLGPGRPARPGGGQSCPQAALFALTAISLAVSRMQRYSPASGFPNMLLVGHLLHPARRPRDRGRLVVRGQAPGAGQGLRGHPPRNARRHAEGLVATADARQLDLPGDSIDYIFTDPPYADAVQYGELNFVWESWLGGTPDWHGDEIVVNPRGARMPAIGPGHAGGDGRVPSRAQAGPLAEPLLSRHVGPPLGDAPGPDARRRFRDRFGRGRREHRDGPEVVQPVDVEQGDQARPGDQFSQAAAGPTASRSAPAVEFDAAARQVLCAYLAAHGSATKDRLYDALVSHLVCLGQMQSFDFEALLRSVAEEDPAAETMHVWKLKRTG